MKVKEVQAALKAGERFFKDWKLKDPVEVIAWGNAWVRYKSPIMAHWISTNIRTFAMGIDGVYKQEGECSSGGGDTNGVLPGDNCSGQGSNKRSAEGVSKDDQENRSLRAKGVFNRVGSDRV
ncbi:MULTISPECIES: hypothetical protein [Paenibacillus]|uniref:hypothetical protein n=1 Tax=Paenibacillus TaxID=44249 RepID=UPI00096C11A7|nr:hypothetical protein [Paenibacillus odorifer]OME05285.1 hypothetical protein BSK60_33180 [Paenibacillus odorifer]